MSCSFPYRRVYLLFCSFLPTFSSTCVLSFQGMLLPPYVISFLGSFSSKSQLPQFTPVLDKTSRLDNSSAVETWFFGSLFAIHFHFPFSLLLFCFLDK